MITAALLLAGAAPPPKIDIAPPLPRETIGDWEVRDIGEGLVFATVGNNAGSVFGTLCSRDSCGTFFNPKISCVAGRKYAGLINAPAQAFPVIMTCTKIADLLVYDIPYDDNLADAMSVGGVLGIAFPMESGQFQVSRFSLTGAARASARAQQIARDNRPLQRQSTTDELTL